MWTDNFLEPAYGESLFQASSPPPDSWPFELRKRVYKKYYQAMSYTPLMRLLATPCKDEIMSILPKQSNCNVQLCCFNWLWWYSFICMVLNRGQPHNASSYLVYSHATQKSPLCTFVCRTSVLFLWRELYSPLPLQYNTVWMPSIARMSFVSPAPTWLVSTTVLDDWMSEIQ